MKRLMIVLLAAVAAAPLGAQPAATQPATQPTTAAAFDPQAALTLLRTLGGVYKSIGEAVDKKDFDTAKQLADDLLAQSDELRRTFGGMPLATSVNLALAQFQRLRDALASKDLEKAKTLMQGLDVMGDSIGDAVYRMTQPAAAAATQPTATTRPSDPH